MSSTSARGPGRHAGSDPATMEKAREYLRQNTLYGTPVEKIAEVEGRSPSHVWDLLKRARAAETGPATASVAAPGEVEPQPPRRLSKRVARARAWDYAEDHLISRLGLDCDAFWVRLVVAIHEDGDGFQLRIGATGGRFRSREDLADLFGRRKVQIDDWLAALFGCERLIDLGGVDIGIPLGLGLTPGENARGKLVANRPGRAAGAAQPPLPFRPHVVGGGLRDSSEITPPDSSLMPIKVESDSSENPIKVESDSSENPISQESAAVARTTTTTTNKLNSFNCSSSSPSETRAGDSSEITPPDSTDISSQRSVSGHNPAPDSTDISSQRSVSGHNPAPDSTDINSQRLRLARQIGELLGYGPPTPADVATVGEWLTYPGISEPLILSAIAEDRQRNPLPVHSFALFTKTIKAALSSERGRATRKASTQPKPPSEADKAKAELRAQVERQAFPLVNWWVGHQIGQRPPFPEAILTHYAAGRRVPADRWLAVMEAARAAGEPCRLLPAFENYVVSPEQYENMMTEAEEAVTAPVAADDG